MPTVLQSLHQTQHAKITYHCLLEDTCACSVSILSQDAYFREYQVLAIKKKKTYFLQLVASLGPTYLILRLNMYYNIITSNVSTIINQIFIFFAILSNASI